MGADFLSNYRLDRDEPQVKFDQNFTTEPAILSVRKNQRSEINCSAMKLFRGFHGAQGRDAGSAASAISPLLVDRFLVLDDVLKNCFHA